MPQPRRYRVLSLGSIAASALFHPGIGEVEAVFRSTFYIRLGSRLICLGPGKLTPGPINCAVTVPDSTNWLACGLVRKAPVQVTSNTIFINRQLHIDYDQDSVWKAPAAAIDLSIKKISSGVTAFQKSIAGRADLDGFGYLSGKSVQSLLTGHTFQVAEEPLLLARRWLSTSFARNGIVYGNDLEWTSTLTGLGMGLTPSGDDFLGGMMIALTRLGETWLCQRLWDSVRYWADRNSNPISLAHLTAAAEGYSILVIHELVTAILQGDINGIKSRIDGIASVGHSSGWDIMLGVVFTIETWLALQIDEHLHSGVLAKNSITVKFPHRPVLAGTY